MHMYTYAMLFEYNMTAFCVVCAVFVREWWLCLRLPPLAPPRRVPAALVHVLQVNLSFMSLEVVGKHTHTHKQICLDVLYPGQQTNCYYILYIRYRWNMCVCECISGLFLRVSAIARFI